MAVVADPVAEGAVVALVEVDVAWEGRPWHVRAPQALAAADRVFRVAAGLVVRA